MAKQATLKSFFLSTGPPPLKAPRVELELDDQQNEDNISSESETELETENDIEQHEESDLENHDEEESGTLNEGNLADCKKECCLVSRNDPYYLVNICSSTRKYGKQNRSIQRSWFKDYKWLTYCTTINSLYCFYCRRKYRNGGFTFGTKFKDAFITTGFINWKKGRQKFKEHEKSHAHKEALFSHEGSVRPTVISMVSSVEQKQQETRRKMLLKQLESLKYLLCQGLAIRGHSNSDEGNLQQLLLLRKEDVHDLDSYLRNKKYLSPEIVNEQIASMASMANQLLRSLLDDIKANQCDQPLFAIIADETRDISGLEQFSLSLRWVDQSYEIYEDFIGMVSVESTGASSLKSVIGLPHTL